MTTVRKLITITLLAVLTLPLLPSLLGLSSANDAGIPACCRGNGMHHCMRRASRDAGDAAHATVSAQCPYQRGAATVVTAHDHSFLLPGRMPAVAYQREVALRFVVRQSDPRGPCTRADRQRGPPSFIV